MKKLLVAACASAVAVSALAGDPMAIAKERARETSDAVSAGQAPPSHSAQPAPGPSTAPNPALVAMQQNVSSLAVDLAALQTDPSKKQPLINDLNVAAQGITPTKSAVEKIAGDFASALTGKNLSLEQRTKIGQYLRATFNCSHLSPAQLRGILDDIPKILQAGGISADASGKIVADVKAIAAETK